MKKSYLNSKLWAVIIFSLFVSAGFYSCDKDEGKSKLSGTTWEVDYFESDVITDESFGKYIVRCDKIIISFKEGVDHKKYYWADVFTENFELYDQILNISYSGFYGVEHLSADYTYNGKNLALTFRETSGFFSEQNWAGTIDGDIMTLINVFGTTVMFKKV